MALPGSANLLGTSQPNFWRGFLEKEKHARIAGSEE